MKVITLFFCVMKQWSFSQTNSERYILWNDTLKPNWNDYNKLDKPKHPTFASATAVVVTYTFVTIQKTEYAKGIALFSKDFSWVLKKNITEDLLQHERLHFDLTEIYARLFTKTIIEMSKNIKGPLPVDTLEKWREQLQVKMDKENLKYDTETIHGMHKEKQKMWSASVKKRLFELEKYR